MTPFSNLPARHYTPHARPVAHPRSLAGLCRPRHTHFMSSAASKRPATAQDSEDDISRAKKPRTNTENAMTAAGEIDEDLHSRQLAVYGRESMRRLAGASVLVCGLKGLGAEIGASSSIGSLARTTDLAVGKRDG